MALLIIVSYLAVMVLIAKVMGKKGALHFRYLRIVDPNRYPHTPAYRSSFKWPYHNAAIQFLGLPFFSADGENENARAAALRTEIKKYVALSWLLIFLFMSPHLYVLLRQVYYSTQAG